MAEDRPQKRAIRNLWVEEVRNAYAQDADRAYPLYLTLPGAEGRDIELLIREGIIATTENSAIAEEDSWKVVAVERDANAFVSVQKRFIGLRIKEMDFDSLISGTSLLDWPDSEGEDWAWCAAKVVNLDLTNPLRGHFRRNQLIFPVVEWIRKLCQIHDACQLRTWSLCLTLHGSVGWTDQIAGRVNRFLRANLGRDADFEACCRGVFGDELVDNVAGNQQVDFSALGRDEQQRLVMMLVPKYIAKSLHGDGWTMDITSLVYGEVSERQAPMVSWIIRFQWSEEAQDDPESSYCGTLRDIFARAGRVRGDGQIYYFEPDGQD